MDRLDQEPLLFFTEKSPHLVTKKVVIPTTNIKFTNKNIYTHIVSVFVKISVTKNYSFVFN